MSILTYLRNKRAPYVLAAGLAASLFTGCVRKESRTELSDILHQNANVVRMEHRNRWMQSIPMRVGKITTIQYIHHPERNIIVLDGEVDFEINNKEIYGRFKEGDYADVLYRESYKLTFEDLNGDGVKEQTGKTLTGYEFVDAQKR